MPYILFAFLSVAFNIEAPSGGLVLLPFLASKQDIQVVSM